MTVLAVASIALVGTGGPAVAGTVKSADSGPTDTTITGTEADARAVAQRYNHKVEVDSETTPTSQVSALPDGSMQLVSSSLPVRVKQGDSWVSVDSDLAQTQDGWFSPKSSGAPVMFGPGGSNQLAKVETSQGDWLAENWPNGTLPAPKVHGSSALYRDVYPGVDLQLNATSTGMSEVLVVKNAKAAANPDVMRVKLAFPDANVALNAKKQITATTSDGSTALSPSPTWWDSSRPGASAQGPGSKNELRPVGHSVIASTMSLNVEGVAKTDGIKYPVYVDPDWSAGAQNYWFTDLAYPDQSYLNGNAASGGIQAVGAGGGYLSRAFWEFGTGPLAGKIVQAAQFSATEVWSNTCTGKDIQAWRYGPGTPGFTWDWDTDHGAWNQLLDTRTLSLGSGCTAGGAVGFNVVGGATWAAANSSGVLQIGLRAADESDQLTRRHFALGATLTVAYDSRPNEPAQSSLAIGNQQCSTSSTTPSMVNNGPSTPQSIEANITDPEASQNVSANVYVAPATMLTQTTLLSTPFGVQGPTTVQISAGRLAEGSYAYRVQGSDGIATGPFSPWCYFTVNNEAPPVPTVSDSPTEEASATVGGPLNVTVNTNAADNALAFEYWWVPGDKAPTAPPVPEMSASGNLQDTGANGCNLGDAGGGSFGAVKWGCADASGDAVITVSPIDTDATLWVATIDKAYNESDPAGINVHVVPSPGVGLTAGHEWATDQLSSPLTGGGTVDDSGNGDLPLTLASGISTVSAPASASPNPDDPMGQALSFDGSTTGSGAGTSAPVVADANSTFTVGAWLDPIGPFGAGQNYVALSEGQTLPPGASFELRISPTNYLSTSENWRFCVSNEYFGGPGRPPSYRENCAVSTEAVVPGQWVHVVGIWDAVAGQIRLLIGDSITPVAADRAAPDATTTGTFQVGTSVVGANAANQWSGLIVDPFIVPGVIDHQQLDALYNLEPLS